MTTIERMLAARDPLADWARCKDHVGAALALTNTHTLDDVAQGVAEGRMHFWPGESSALVTEVHRFPRTSNLHIFLAGGDLDELRAMDPSLASWGRFLGCSKLTLAGRPGWERALKHQGWAKEVVVLSRPITLEPKQ
jgi:hypothetical protein